MIKKTHKYVRDTLWSMKNAKNGLSIGFFRERNFRTELAIFVVTVCAGVLLGFSLFELGIVLFAGFCVLGAELLNTAIEESWDKLHPEHHESVGRIKDLASGGVFLFGLGAALLGLSIFTKYLF
jgi:diacylglycerol kinase (ATP)